MGLTTIASKRGNDHGDVTARKGVELVRLHIVALAAWLHDKHGDYTKFMDRVHYYMIKVMEIVKAKREAKRVLLKAATDKHTFGKIHIVSVMDFAPDDEGAYRLAMGPLPRGIHKFHQDRWQLNRIRAFIAETKWAPAIESGRACTWLELYAGFCCYLGERKAAIALRNLARKPFLDQQLKLFQQHVRYVALMCIDSGREGLFTTPVTICTRLRALGITNHHAAFAASPVWNRGQAKAVTIMMLQQKG